MTAPAAGHDISALPRETPERGAARLPYAVAVSLGAFLLFMIQPLMGRRILPVFGGSSAVWIVCLLFFQSLLMVGYGYAFVVSSRVAPRRQGRVHLLVLTFAAVVLLFPADPLASLSDSLPPVLRILILLFVSIGLPYIALAATAPLMQEWFNRIHGGPHPYRWYALSNAAALTALITYPVLIEPALSLSAQKWCWTGGFLVYAAAVAWCAAGIGNTNAAASPPPDLRAPGARPALRRVALWTALAAAGSVMLLATTNQITQEVASVPLLWMLPLIIYLITFIICFDRERWYDRRVFGPFLAATMTVAVSVLARQTAPYFWIQLVVYLATLFAGCMVCHGELVRLRPDPRYLTGFYMALSIGGALGGLLVGLVAPMVFSGFWEFQVALAGCCWIGALAALSDRRWRGDRRLMWGRLGVGAALVALSVALGLQVEVARSGAVFRERSFYGVLRVVEVHDALGARRSLVSGRTLHGRQFLQSDRRRLATTYYAPATGVGLAINNHPHRLAPSVAADNSFSVGVVGLGVGTLAAYGRPGDRITFYELDPNDIDIANRYFTFLGDSPASVRVIVGDARLQMERELAAGNADRFDVLVVDAFTGDAVPVHLLTAECMATYLRRLKPDGLIAIHVSNRSLDLGRVVRGLARLFKLRVALVSTPSDPATASTSANWMILGAPGHSIFQEGPVATANGDWPYGWVTPAFAAERLRISEAEVENRVRAGAIPVGKDRSGQRLVRIEVEDSPVIWTDDRSGIWEVLRLK
jgi:hypothetical protein